MASKKFATREEMLKSISNQAIQDQETVQNKQKKQFFINSFQKDNALPYLAIRHRHLLAIPNLQKNFVLTLIISIQLIDPTDENHRVIIQPRNVQTTNIKSGKVKSSYFSVPGFTTVGDPYIDPERRHRLEELGSKLKTPKDQPTFKPQNSFKAICGEVPYKHDTNYKGPKTKPKLDVNNKVIIGPSNVLVSPYGGPKFPPFEKDEYNRYRIFKRKEQLEHEQLLKEKQPFRTWDIGNKNFYSDKQQFNTDNLPKKTMKKPLDLHIMKHDQVFKYSSPPKKGYNKTINKFPVYKESPWKYAVRHEVSDEKKETFKFY